MDFKHLDLFSTQFQFNVGQRQDSKRSTIGALLSIIIISLSIAYFIYLTFLYFENQIDPKYKSQTFITDDSIKINFDNNIAGFRFEYDVNMPIELLQQQTGKQYFILMAFFEVQSPKERKFINIDVIKCEKENLQGYNCLDLSNVSQETLENNNTENIYKQIIIMLYKCTDIDMYKTSIPSNCASQQQIEQAMYTGQARFRIKMLTSQYDTISEEVQTSYKNFIQYFTIVEQLYVTLKAVKQTTLIKKGPFIQSQSTFSSPIDYNVETRVFALQDSIDQFNMGMQMYLMISVAEQYQQIQIQFPTFMEILAICNSTFAVIMSVGFIGRYFSKQLIKEDISLLLLQNIYQIQYLKSLKVLNIFQNKLSKQEGNIDQNDVIENTESVFIPSFMTKSNETEGINQINLFESPKDLPLDIILENNKVKQQQQHQVNKNTVQSNDLKSERSNFKIIKDDKKITNTSSGNQASNKFYCSSIQKESSHQIIQKQRKNLNLYRQQQYNQTPDSENGFMTLKQLKLDLLQQKSNFDMNTQNKSEVNSNREKNEQQSQINKNIMNLNAIQDISFANKVKNLLFKSMSPVDYIRNLLFKLKQPFDLNNLLNANQFYNFRCCKRKIELNSILEPNFKKCLEEEVNSNLDILQIYKDIIILKKAIMILMSKDQFAAIQLIGCSGNYSSKLSEKQNKNTEINEDRMNVGHLDEQFLIQQSFKKQEEEINVFLQRWQNKQDWSEIDKRIYSSLTYS